MLPVIRLALESIPVTYETAPQAKQLSMLIAGLVSFEVAKQLHRHHAKLLTLTYSGHGTSSPTVSVGSSVSVISKVGTGDGREVGSIGTSFTDGG